jgi:hypothetical protein
MGTESGIIVGTSETLCWTQPCRNMVGREQVNVTYNLVEVKSIAFKIVRVCTLSEKATEMKQQT